MNAEGKATPPWTRRGLISAASLAIGGIAAVSGAREGAKMAEAQSTGTEGLLTYLHQEVDLEASPARAYGALLDSREFAAFTGAPAQIDRNVGGAFSLFGGAILGRNVELVPDARIVQAWRPSNWEPGLYSLVRFQLTARDGGATIVLDHTGFPEGSFRHLNPGWYSHYWDPLRKFLR